MASAEQIDPDEGASKKTAGVADVLVRTTFFIDKPDDFEQFKPDLRDVAEAVSQLARFIDAAFLLAEEDWSTNELTGVNVTQRALRDVGLIEIDSIAMNSPLTVVFTLPAKLVVKLGSEMVDLAEKVCTLPSRVGASRAKNLRKKALADRERALIKEGKLDALVLSVLAPQSPPFGVRPEQMDFLDAKAKDDERLLTVEQATSPKTTTKPKKAKPKKAKA